MYNKKFCSAEQLKIKESNFFFERKYYNVGFNIYNIGKVKIIFVFRN